MYPVFSAYLHTSNVLTTNCKPAVQETNYSKCTYLYSKTAPNSLTNGVRHQ